MTKYRMEIDGETLEGAILITRHVIRQIVATGQTRFKAKDVATRLRQLLPDYNDNTLANMHAMCVNSNSRKHYHSTEDFLVLVKRGEFALYQPEADTTRTETLQRDLDDIARRAATHSITATTAASLIRTRKGQGAFRQGVLKRYPACPVSGVKDPRFLVAGHIKPWRDSSDAERLEPDNGLMFAPNIDALFDGGFISFTDDGVLIVSPHIAAETLLALGITIPVAPIHVREETAYYLEWHRTHVFRK
ncbi:HNH endonuclease [uncultured Cardiobacterium sp.]|uniref:HNH endonuclease n=1 Tax=uncultured Cardiobacterium sp. TaxID=417619 RepID=UPI00260162F1|nr:HNH endonuclease [uncultured Cardiobacterium sp.]